MNQQYEELDLIEEITRNDNSKYFEISNIDQNGIAELAVDRGKIKNVRILQLNIPRTTALVTYEKYINKTYQLETLTNEEDWKNPDWVEWEKPKGKILDAYKMILKSNQIGQKVGEMEKLRILHTNDLHSHFEHFPKIGRYLHEAQKDQSVDQVFTFDAGDFMDRSHPLTDATYGQANIKLMNSFHYDAITIGNNEGISNSHEVVEHLFDHAKFPVILANLREEDESMPHWAVQNKIITTKKGTRIALIGLTAAYPLSYEPNHWHVKMLKETMDDVLPKIAGQYDVLILLTHVGLNMDEFLAKNYPQIDLIVGGHTHDLLKHGKRVNGVWITQTGKWGNYVGNTYVEIDDQHHVKKITPHVEPTSLMKEHNGDIETILGYCECGKEILSREQVANLP